MIEDTKATVAPALAKTADIWASEGKTVLYVVRNSSVIGALAVEDEIRPESAEAVKALHEHGVRVAMITGDAQTVGSQVKRLGIDEVAAQVLPADKASAVERFQSGGKKVAMVGDGVNDAPALATSCGQLNCRDLIAIPVPAGIFVRWGPDLPMSVGALAMSISTIVVALNAQLLRRLNLGHKTYFDRGAPVVTQTTM